ncbi:hypothetical protein N7456_004849 [Penicillium angulare]|uniref:Enoyl reductase (ER) domain-containing protein n=1 Tax=Penicillium angulare TaxID=116970 RepID=A0A9W9FXB2_9EURO|nr:hypothetical protein N7456_004849 [Penicillium angulare]
MGHEFTGEVVETGDQVKTFKKGEKVVSPFTVSCGDCYYCARGFSSRCARGQLYGSVILDGGQAEYVRVPLADSTLFHAPAAIDEKKLVLMADIFPTGYFAASNGFKSLSPTDVQESTVLLFGCGPVGICALVSALEHRPKNLIAIDSVPARLELAKSLGAEPWNFQENEAGLRERVKELTDGRGADVVIEVVGHSSALRMGFELLRPWGVLSSVGVHNGEIPWTGNEAYGKNLRIQMGRCPVRTNFAGIFPEAMDLLAKKQNFYGRRHTATLPSRSGSEIEYLPVTITAGSGSVSSVSTTTSSPDATGTSDTSSEATKSSSSQNTESSVPTTSSVAGASQTSSAGVPRITGNAYFAFGGAAVVLAAGTW